MSDADLAGPAPEPAPEPAPAAPETPALAVKAEPAPKAPAVDPAPAEAAASLKFRIIADATLSRDGVDHHEGDTVELTDPRQAWQLISQGLLRALTDDGELMAETDQCVLIDFATHGLTFNPADWS